MTMTSVAHLPSGAIRVYRLDRPARRLNPFQQIQRFLRRRRAR
jgi:hypothetical protein